MDASDYRYVLVESWRAGGGPVRIRPVAGQGFSPDLHVQCSSSLKDLDRYPLGTQFRIRARLANDRSGGVYLYSHHQWRPEVVRLARDPRLPG